MNILTNLIGFLSISCISASLTSWFYLSGGNPLFDLRAVVSPYTPEEIRECFESSSEAQAMIAEVESLGYDLEWWNQSVEPAVISIIIDPFLREPGESPRIGEYRHRTHTIALTGTRLYRHTFGCDEWASLVGHELNHALDHLNGVPYDPNLTEPRSDQHGLRIQREIVCSLRYSPDCELPIQPVS